MFILTRKELLPASLLSKMERKMKLKLTNIFYCNQADILWSSVE